MMIPVLVIAATAILFFSMILLLAAKPKFAGRLTGTFIIIAILGGLFFYGVGFALTLDSLPLAIIRALLAVCGMFVAKMDIGSISAAPFMQHTWAQALFWIVHLFALYATASAAITTVGAEALRKLRLWFARWGQLALIYGVNDNSVALGKKLLARKNRTVVFIDAKPNASLSAAIIGAGCVLRSDANALQGNVKFLQSVGMRAGRRKLTLYALSEDMSDALRYADLLKSALQSADISPAQTSLVICGRENSPASGLQALGDRYGYGSVSVIQDASLAARILMREYPPCNSINFGTNARATENFEALVIGFGEIGQAVLRNLVRNGQFEGSSFRTAVFSPDCQSAGGYFCRTYRRMLQQYDISFHPYDARSGKMYEYLLERGANIKYVVVCTGSDKLNLEIADHLRNHFREEELTIPVYLCSHQGVRTFRSNGQTRFHSLYDPDVLSMAELDKMAMILNHHYMKDSERTEQETWMDCDYFSRMSCRASADFLPAMVRMAGTTEAQLLDNGWNLSAEQLENLGRTEHLRWCAFHYSMGFTPMSQSEYDTRATLYTRQKERGEKPTIRVGKNMQNRTHACLIDWDALDELSHRETELTGKTINYKEMDLDNVRAVPELLQRHHELGA